MARRPNLPPIAPGNRATSAFNIENILDARQATPRTSNRTAREEERNATTIQQNQTEVELRVYLSREQQRYNNAIERLQLEDQEATAIEQRQLQAELDALRQEHQRAVSETERRHQERTSQRQQAIQAATVQEQRRHRDRAQDLEEQLLAEQDRNHQDVDSEHWLENRAPINPDQERPSRPTFEERASIRARVQRWANRRCRSQRR